MKLNFGITSIHQSLKHQSNFVLKLYWATMVALAFLSVIVPKGLEVLWINGNHNVFEDHFFSSITKLGEGWLFIPILTVLLFVKFKYALMGFSVAALHSLICLITKKILFAHELRPKNLLDNSLLHFVPGVDVHGYQSFPSGHTATIFCIAVFLSLLLQHRLWSVFLLALALGVAYSRIYLLQHFLIDIAAGACIGAISSFLVWHVFEGLKLPPWTNSSFQIKWQHMKGLKKIRT